ncbi:hypothetical protein SEA_SATIS_68 [Streptomyces phage Satis]|nr:hypothetical protein SEA_SATIS_68 [Streptomyces phage Satis]
MARKPTGRPPGRPPGDRYGTPQERVSRARTLLPSLQHFPHLLKAVERVLEDPNRTVFRSPYNYNPADVDLLHVYSPAERGQILSFTWWAYVNRRKWNRRRRLAAVTLLSPLMLFSSAFFEEMTDIPFKNVSKWMVRPEGMLASRVTGSCDMRLVHLALEAAARGDQAFRTFTADIVRSKGVPGAMASRLTGVPGPALLDPGRGVQFTPLGPDLDTLSVRSREEQMIWTGLASERDLKLVPYVFGQDWVRDLFPEMLLKENIFTATPVPRNGENCYHLCIPELPKAHRARHLGPKYYDLLYSWEDKYLLPATTGTF